MQTLGRVILMAAACAWGGFLYFFLYALSYEPCCGYAPVYSIVLYAFIGSSPVWLPALVPNSFSGLLFAMRGVCGLFLILPAILVLTFAFGALDRPAWMTVESQLAIAAGWAVAGAALVAASVVLLFTRGGVFASPNPAAHPDAR